MDRRAPTSPPTRVAALLALLLIAAAPTLASEPVPELRACWLTQYTYLNRSDAQLRDIARNIKAGGMNTVYVALYAGQQVYWPSKAYQAAGGNWGSANIDYAERLTRIFHEEGLKVGAWFEYGLAVGYQWHPIAVNHPDWLARDRFGNAVTGENGGFVFLSPGHPAATQLMADMVTELAENYNFDDIQIDRFRWGRTTAGREFGYEQVTRDAYFAKYGLQPPDDINHPTWVRFREELVNDVVRRCYEAIKAANPEITVSSAPTGSYGITQHMQRWSDWLTGGYMDLVMPQMYMTSFNAFSNEFFAQLAQAPDHWDQVAVGYRASEHNDWQLVAQQMDLARQLDIPHGCLWVYHQYSSQIAIQDEIDNLPQPGQPYAQPAYNPFVSDRMLQLVIDNADAGPHYLESGSWTTTTTPGFFRFTARQTTSAAPAGATFASDIPKPGRYDVFAWYSSAANRHPAAPYTVLHALGETTVTVDQRTAGGQWVPLGRYLFNAEPLDDRVLLTNAAAAPAQTVAADAIKLQLTGYAFGDVDGDAAVTDADWLLLEPCSPGAIATPGDPCEALDFDDDGDGDLVDFARFQAATATSN
jgi:uncharacterized lipoprotein YddW (UPF0748 family)